VADEGGARLATTEEAEAGTVVDGTITEPRVGVMTTAGTHAGEMTTGRRVGVAGAEETVAEIGVVEAGAGTEEDLQVGEDQGLRMAGEETGMRATTDGAVDPLLCTTETIVGDLLQGNIVLDLVLQGATPHPEVPTETTRLEDHPEVHPETCRRQGGDPLGIIHHHEDRLETCRHLGGDPLLGTIHHHGVLQENSHPAEAPRGICLLVVRRGDPQEICHPGVPPEVTLGVLPETYHPGVHHEDLQGICLQGDLQEDTQEICHQEDEDPQEICLPEVHQGTCHPGAHPEVHPEICPLEDPHAEGIYLPEGHQETPVDHPEETMDLRQDLKEDPHPATTDPLPEAPDRRRDTGAGARCPGLTEPVRQVRRLHGETIPRPPPAPAHGTAIRPPEEARASRTGGADLPRPLPATDRRSLAIICA